MRLTDCHNIEDFRDLARRRLPAPIFHYIDGGADDEVTLARNTDAFDDWDLVPSVLAGMNDVDLTTTVLGRELKSPLFLAPTAMHRMFHHEGEPAVARVAGRYGTMYGISTLATTGIEEMGALTDGPKLFQLYVHKDREMTFDLVDRCRTSGFDALALTVDTIVGGNRERDLYTGFTTPPKLTLASLLSFALHPHWSLNYLARDPLVLENIVRYLKSGGDLSYTVVEYINTHLSSNISWDDAAQIRERWGGPFAIKGIVSADDARRAVDIGATAIMVSNHGGRQLDGSLSALDALVDIVDTVGDQVEVILDGGIRRGTHVLKALALGAKACAGGRLYLYALAGGGEAGVERAMQLLHNEITRDMMLMGCKRIADMDRSKVRHR